MDTRSSTIEDIKTKCSELTQTKSNELTQPRPSLIKDEVVFKRKTYWTCCGERLDSRLIQYFVKVMMGLIGILFCMVKIFTAKKHECSGEDTTVYISTLFTIIGIFVPSPVIK